MPEFIDARSENIAKNRCSEDLLISPSIPRIIQVWQNNSVMFLRKTERRKNGKTHIYWSVVESGRLDDGRVAQRRVLYLGEHLLIDRMGLALPAQSPPKIAAAALR